MPIALTPLSVKDELKLFIGGKSGKSSCLVLSSLFFRRCCSGKVGLELKRGALNLLREELTYDRRGRLNLSRCRFLEVRGRKDQRTKCKKQKHKRPGNRFFQRTIDTFLGFPCLASGRSFSGMPITHSAAPRASLKTVVNISSLSGFL